MDMFLNILIAISALSVLVVLGAGLVTLVRGGPSGVWSNRLMRWRVVLQGVAIAILLLAFYLKRSGG